MKFGIRTPSLKKRISARISPKRILAHSVGLKMPRGYGWVRNPKKYLYNKIYNKTSFSIDSIVLGSGSAAKLIPQNSINIHETTKTKVNFTARSKKKALVLAIFLGLLGAHRFYLGKTFSAVIMALLTLSGYGVFITLIWLMFDMFNLLSGATMAEYDHKVLVSKYDNILEENFLKDFLEFNKKYPRYAKKYEEAILFPLMNINIDGTMKEKIQSLKNAINSSRESVNSALNRSIKYDIMISEPLKSQLAPFTIQKSEKCYFSAKCNWNEIRKDRTHGEYWKEIHKGTVALTNKRIVFQTEESKIKRVLFKNAPEVAIVQGGVFIQKSKGKSPLLSDLDKYEFYIQYSKIKEEFFDNNSTM